MKRRFSAVAATKPSERLPHPRMPIRTRDALGAKVRGADSGRSMGEEDSLVAHAGMSDLASAMGGMEGLESSMVRDDELIGVYVK